MKFGLLKDIKPGEYRTIVTPAEVEAIVRDGHEVYVQRGAGAGAGFADEQYARRAPSWWTPWRRSMGPAILSPR